MTTTEIRDHLASYVDNQTTFTQFENWLVTRSLNMHKDSDAEAQELILDLSEHINACVDGLINEAALRIALTPYATTYRAQFAFTTRPDTETRSAATSRLDFAQFRQLQHAVQ